MKLFLLIFLSLLVSSAYPQKGYFPYKTVKGGEGFSFPIFSSLKKPLVVKRINQLLQISELAILKGFENKNIFENATYDNGSIYGGKKSINYYIHTNNSKILSLNLDQSSCGATCAYWVSYYNFNSGNGDLIQLRDLFTAENFKKFYRYVTTKRVAQLKKQLKQLEKEQQASLADIIENYQSDDLTDFYIKDIKFI